MDPRSASLITALEHQLARYPVGIAVYKGSVPIYTVPFGERRVHVTLDQSTAPLLQQAFDSVPLPADARPAAGPDANLAVWQPATNTLWEFWRMRRAADGWHAAWGGRMLDVSASPGWYELRRDSAGRIVEQPFWGAPATKFSVVAGLMRIAELQAGHIPHALAFALAETRRGVYAYPAQATDGRYLTPDAIPEGTRFRLDPTLDIAKLNLPPVTRMMAEAAQRYGMIVENTSVGTAFRGEQPTRPGYDPYHGLFDVPPRKLLASFPWTRLQVLCLKLHKSP